MKTLAAVVLDVVTGIVAFAVFVALDTFFHVASDMRSAIIGLALLFLGAGLLRGRGGNACLKGLVVSSGGGLVMLIVFMAAIFHTVLAILVVTAVLFAVFGVFARQLLADQSFGRAGLMMLAPLAALVVVVLAAVPRLAGGLATRETASPAPAFSVSRLDGTLVRSSDWHGHVAVIDYWATWCPACRRELPALDSLYRQYQNDPDVVFWAVDVQTNGETPEKARAYFQNSGYAFPLAIDSQDSADLLSKHFAFEGFPALILIGRDGRVRLVHIGYDRAEPLQENLSKEIEALRKQPA